MRRYSSVLVVGALLVAAVMVFSLVNAETALGLPFQATEEPTSEPTVEPTAEMETPTAAAPTAESATAAPGGMMAYPPCVDTTETGADLGATAEATADMSADMSMATSEATAAATADMSGMATSEATVDVSQRGYLGVVVAAVGDCGVRVVQVTADGPAFLGLLAVDDVIVAVNGVAVTSLVQNDAAMGEGAGTTDSGLSYSTPTTRSFFKFIQSMPPGTSIVLTVQRGGDQQIDLMVTLGALTTGGISDSESPNGSIATSEATMDATMMAMPTQEITATP
ncbi:MAG: PDZ domain-containing protein [Anaerolineae bacterium]